MSMIYVIDSGVLRAFDASDDPSWYEGMRKLTELEAMEIIESQKQVELINTCTPAQGLVALFALKQITEEHILDAISQIPDPIQKYTARIGYQHATTWERNSPTMMAMAQLLQLSEQDLDELFTYAVSVQV